MGSGKKAERIPPALWIGFCLVFLILLAAGIFFYQGQERRLRREAVETLSSIAELKAGQIGEWRRERLADAAEDTATPMTLQLLREWLTAPNRNSSGEIFALFEAQRKSHGYPEILIVDKEGRTLLASPDKSESSQEEVTAALTAAAQERGPALTGFYLGLKNLRPSIGSVVPIFASDAELSPLLGAVVTIIDPEIYFFPLIESWPTPSASAETLLVTRDGDDALFLNELRHRKNTSLKLRVPLNRTEVPATMAAQGREGAVEGLDYRGVRVLAVLKKIPDSPWFMVSKIDRAEAFAGWQTRAALIIALILALIAAAAASFLVLWQRRVKVHYRALHEAESARDLSEARYRTTLLSIGDGVIVADREGRIAFINPTAERLTGWSRNEARSLPLEKVFSIVNEETRLPVENPVQRVLREGLIVGLANHTLLISRDGREIPIADSGAPIRHKDGPITGVVLVFSDQTAERRVENEMRLNEARLRALVDILQRPAGSVQEYLDHALNEALRLTDSKIGYIYHYDENRRQFVLNTWSKEVMKECTVAIPQTRYELEKTGLWGEAVRQRKPIILNDFSAVNPLKKGFPEGHAKLNKFMTIPVFNQGKIVSVVGVANKETDYTDMDVLQLSLLMETVWRVVERIKAEEARWDSEKKFRSVFESANVGKSMTLVSGIVDPNDALCRMLGYTREELKDKRWQDLTPADEVRDTEKILEPLLKGAKDSARFEKRYVRKDGTLFWADVSTAIVRDDRGSPVYFITNVIDINERKQAEDALRQSEDLYRLLSENSTDVIWLFDIKRMRLTYISPSVHKLRGYTPEEVQTQSLGEILTPESLLKFQEILPRALAAYKAGVPATHTQTVEIDQPRRDGSIVQTEIVATVLRNERDEPFSILGVSRDISERKEVERRLWTLSSRQQAMLAAIPDIIMEVDENKVYTWANQAGIEFFGPDVVGQEAAFYFEGEQSTYEIVKPLFNGHEDVIYVESWQRSKDGQKRLLAWWCRVLKNSEGRVVGALSSARDVTEQKAAEDKIRQSLKEREVMLREIHHRVKNNIQIISSLLRLQSRRLDDEKAREALTQSQNRIRSMALIHEKLYQTGDFARIDLGNYFESMGSHLLSVYRDLSGRVSLRVEVREISLDINRAIPVGLIVNELVTNALKHAFPGSREGEILIRLIHPTDEPFELTVKDTGIGFVDPGQLASGNSLGLEIIRDLVKQIDGSIDIRNDGGTEISIRF